MNSTIFRTNSIFLPEISRAAGNFDRSLLPEAIKLLKMLMKAACKGLSRGSRCFHRAPLKKHQGIDNMKEITSPVALNVAVQDLDEAGGGIHAQHVAGAEEFR